MDGDIFVLCDTRLGLADEAPFKKLWGESVWFDSHSRKKGVGCPHKRWDPY